MYLFGVLCKEPQDATAAPGEAIAPASTFDASTLAPLLTALQSSQVKSEQIHVLQDGQRRHERDINQIRILMVAVLLVLVLVVVLLLIAVMR